MASEPDLYELLGVSRDADAAARGRMGHLEDLRIAGQGAVHGVQDGHPAVARLAQRDPR